jgi:hypothetical protein
MTTGMTVESKIRAAVIQDQRRHFPQRIVRFGESDILPPGTTSA